MNYQKLKKWIAIDWGTSNFRAYLMKNGEVLDQISSNDGMKFVKKNDFVVITAGLPFGKAGMTNMVRLYKVGS